MPTRSNNTDRVLDSWKEIAVFLKRGVRTVQRWEATEGLPVRRHLHQKRSSVFALQSEVEAWRRACERKSEGNGKATSLPVKSGLPRMNQDHLGRLCVIARKHAARARLLAAKLPKLPKLPNPVGPSMAQPVNVVHPLNPGLTANLRPTPHLTIRRA